MSKIAVELTPRELDRLLISLNWYIDDREECAKIEAASIYDAGAEESQSAARDASKLLNKLRRALSPSAASRSA